MSGGSMLGMNYKMLNHYQEVIRVQESFEPVIMQAFELIYLFNILMATGRFSAW